MTVPSRAEAASRLRSLDPPAWFLRHACAVADVTAWLAARCVEQGRTVDRQLVEVAALLHDVDKVPSAGAPARLRHGDGSAAWLEAAGWAELAPIVRDHPVTRLADPAWERWRREASLEARIVAYADKRAGQRLEPMAARFASWRRRYPAGPGDPDTGSRPAGSGWDDEVAALVAARAAQLEADVCAAAGVAPADVRRLRWSRAALAGARP